MDLRTDPPLLPDRASVVESLGLQLVPVPPKQIRWRFNGAAWVLEEF